jgi:hypothetical protein
MQDRSFQRVWRLVAAIWEHRDDTRRKQWEALVLSLEAFAAGLPEAVEEAPTSATVSGRVGRPPRSRRSRPVPLFTA